MEDRTLELFAELICCVSKHLLNYTENESQMLKVIKVAVEKALKKGERK